MDGLAMTRRKPSKPPRRERGQFYIAIQFWEMESSAFRALSADATLVYLFMRKKLDFDCLNNGRVPFSLREAQETLHSGWHRAANALAELMHFGFIKPGKSERSITIRAASTWTLTAFPCGRNEPPKDFMQWSGKPFVKVYRGHLGKPTLEAREAARKQTPTSNTTSICRRVRGTHLVVLEADGDKSA
jgi:hypothetical protein